MDFSPPGNGGLEVDTRLDSHQNFTPLVHGEVTEFSRCTILYIVGLINRLSSLFSSVEDLRVCLHYLLKVGALFSDCRLGKNTSVIASLCLENSHAFNFEEPKILATESKIERHFEIYWKGNRIANNSTFFLHVA